MNRALAVTSLLLAFTGIAAADGYPSGPGPCDDVAACESACTAGNMKSCTWGGFLVLQAPFDKDSRAKAKVMFEAACTKGDGESCWQAATLEERISGDANAAKVVAAYGRACKKQHIRACVNEGYWTIKASGDKAKPQGMALYKKAATIAAQRCDKKKDALVCDWLSRYYADGYFAPQDSKKAEQYRQRACKITTKKPCEAAN